VLAAGRFRADGAGLHVRRAMKRRLEAILRHFLQHLDRGLTGAQVTEIQYFFFLFFFCHMSFPRVPFMGQLVEKPKRSCMIGPTECHQSAERLT
jgi:hypothetical protein